MFRNLSTVGLPLSGRPSELIELALSFGFDAMDIDIVDFQQQAEAFGVEHARRLMVSARLQCGSFHLPISLIGDDAAFNADLAELPTRLEFAQATEAKRAIVTSPRRAMTMPSKTSSNCIVSDSTRSAACLPTTASASDWRWPRRPRPGPRRLTSSSTPTKASSAW